MSRTRVVVTGLGTTNPVGGDVPSTWDALVNGRSGVQHIEADWAEDMAVKIAGVAAVEPTEVLERVKARRLDRTAQFAMVAAMEAWQDSGLADVQDEIDHDRLGVSLASGIGGRARSQDAAFDIDAANAALRQERHSAQRAI